MDIEPRVVPFYRFWKLHPDVYNQVPLVKEKKLGTHPRRVFQKIVAGVRQLSGIYAGGGEAGPGEIDRLVDLITGFAFNRAQYVMFEPTLNLALLDILHQKLKPHGVSVYMTDEHPVEAGIILTLAEMGTEHAERMRAAKLARKQQLP